MYFHRSMMCCYNNTVGCPVIGVGWGTVIITVVSDDQWWGPAVMTVGAARPERAVSSGLLSALFLRVNRRRASARGAAVF